MFDKNNKSNRYVTRGIEHYISPKIQNLIWFLIDTMQVEEKDYLQVFDLESVEKDNNIYQHITHKQEIPDYKNSLVILDLLNIEIVDDVKIFVIDDERHQTMMLNYEY